jgi:hypothetical protein
MLNPTRISLHPKEHPSEHLNHASNTSRGTFSWVCACALRHKLTIAISIVPISSLEILSTGERDRRVAGIRGLAWSEGSYDSSEQLCRSSKRKTDRVEVGAPVGGGRGGRALGAGHHRSALHEPQGAVVPHGLQVLVLAHQSRRRGKKITAGSRDRGTGSGSV